MRVQIYATIALALIAGSPKVLEALRKIAGADSSGSNLRGVAVWALGMQRDAGSTDLLAKIAASDKVNEVRTTAEGALKAIKDGPGPEFEAASMARSMCRRDDPARGNCFPTGD